MKLYFTGFFIIVGLFLIFKTQAQIPCEDGFADIYPCEGFNLSSHFTLEELGGGVKGNDCWGWTDVASGREFVLYCRSSGMSVVEITDPINPIFTAVLPAAALESTWRDVKVLGDYAYIVSMADNHGMQILELTQLLDFNTFPTILSESAHYSGFSFAHNFAINEETKCGYAVGTDFYDGGLFVVDLEDPLQPVLVGSFDESSTHDLQS
ncbi:MAG: choice-of-anchor B family protein, partial [Bacteroidetes bacterium]|nr:choice-of-anchor B family protein [Bacteroidota bacterium]